MNRASYSYETLTAVYVAVIACATLALTANIIMK